MAKNRDVTRPKKKAMEISLADVLGNFKVADSTRYHNGDYVTTSGIIVGTAEKGPESSNCKTATKKTGDLHIYLGLTPDEDLEDCMVVEITPAYKAKHKNYAKDLEKGAHVKVSGYMIYDFEHLANAKNTCRSCKSVWRKTCWEIHPVTEIRVDAQE
jgi:hypothetical protein